ncbi:basal-body rod modification protein FlgD [alpha proteobacterium Q-1]|nr:basal-body rod modification protein FlgD [alpha proteobacterium Q-1]
MDITNTSSVGSATTNALSGDINTFLQLLTAQLRNQDPLNPVDNTEFVAQLAQFSQVEQQLESNSSLKSILDVMKGQSLSDQIAFMGQIVEARTDRLPLGPDGAQIQYRLDNPADAVTITILGPGGEPLATLPGSVEAGANTVLWDGRGEDGIALPPGSYAIAIESLRNGLMSRVDPVIAGVVSQVRVNEAGEADLILSNGLTVPADSITRAAAPMNPVAPAG